MRSFDFDRNAITAWSDGDCWRLAIALNALTGWRIVTVYEDEDVTSCTHAAVENPDGAIVDIFGVWDGQRDVEEWLDRFSYGTDTDCGYPASADELISYKWRTWFPDWDADEWAQKVLDKYNAELVA